MNASHRSQALHESAAAAKKRSDALSANAVTPPKPLPLPPTADPPPPAAPEPVAISPPPHKGLQEEIQVLSPVDYDGLVNRAISQEEEGLSQLRRKAGDAGVVRYSGVLFMKHSRHVERSCGTVKGSRSKDARSDIFEVSPQCPIFTGTHIYILYVYPFSVPPPPTFEPTSSFPRPSALSPPVRTVHSLSLIVALLYDRYTEL